VAVVGFWISVAVLIVAVAAGVAFAVYRGICLYRRARRTSDAFAEPMAHIEAATASIEGHLAEAEASSKRLSEAAEQLRISRARLDVQLGAVRDARVRARRVFWFVPGL
jgi:hypothetical protein